MKTKLTRLIVALSVLALPALVQAQFIIVTNNGTATITGYTGGGGAVVIPAATNGCPVTAIGEQAFYGDFSITDVTIPSSVTNIQDGAFSFCTGLMSLTIPEGVITIEANAFFGCGLTNVTIPASVTSIGDQEFTACRSLIGITVDDVNPAYSSLDGTLFDKAKTTLIQYPAGVGGSYTIPDTVTSIADAAFGYASSLTSVVMPEGVTNIGYLVFYGCSALASVNIPDTVTSIGIDAFHECDSLTSVTIPGSVVSIGSDAFSGCTSLTSINVYADNPAYSSLDGVLFDKNQAALLQFPSGLGGDYTIPGGVTNIAEDAFYNSTMLTSVTIPNNVTSIGEGAFETCDNLTSINIPGSVTNIGVEAFAYCVNLTSADFSGNAPPDNGNAFYSAPATVYYLTETTGWGSTFGGVPTALWIPFSWTTNDGAITITSYDTAAGPNVVIPASINGYPVTTIADSAFWFDTGVTSVTIPASVTSIGVGAFNNCTSLMSVTIPGSVTSFGNSAFYNCASLTSAYFLGNAPPDDGTVFYADPATVYYLPGTTGWEPTFGGVPALLWDPQATAMSVTGGQFSFTLTGPPNASIAVEACTNLSNPVWLPVVTNILDGFGTSAFSDPQSGNYPMRFYRFRSP